MVHWNSNQFHSIENITTRMGMKLISTQQEYQLALDRLSKILDAPLKTKEGQEAKLLTLLIKVYEEAHLPIVAQDPIAAIRNRMAERKLKQKDLVGIIGSKSIVSEIINKRRKLTVNMIRNLSDKLNINAEILIQDYEINK